MAEELKSVEKEVISVEETSVVVEKGLPDDILKKLEAAKITLDDLRHLNRPEMHSLLVTECGMTTKHFLTALRYTSKQTVSEPDESVSETKSRRIFFVASQRFIRFDKPNLVPWTPDSSQIGTLWTVEQFLETSKLKISMDGVYLGVGNSGGIQMYDADDDPDEARITWTLEEVPGFSSFRLYASPRTEVSSYLAMSPSIPTNGGIITLDDPSSSYTLFRFFGSLEPVSRKLATLSPRPTVARMSRNVKVPEGPFFLEFINGYVGYDGTNFITQTATPTAEETQYQWDRETTDGDNPEHNFSIYNENTTYLRMSSAGSTYVQEGPVDNTTQFEGIEVIEEVHLLENGIPPRWLRVTANTGGSNGGFGSTTFETLNREVEMIVAVKVVSVSSGSVERLHFRMT